MSKYRNMSHNFFVMLAILMLPGRLHNYNLKFYNWTYLSFPIADQTIYAFSNTNDCARELETIGKAAATWNGSDAGFVFPLIQEGPSGGFHFPTPKDGQNQIGWLSWWPPAYSGMPAVTVTWVDTNSNKVVQVDTAFDDEQLWSTAPETPEEAYDVESVMLHEFGHWLFLWHSVDAIQESKEIVMQPQLDPGVERRELAPDDIDGIKAIYKYQGWAGRRLTYNAGWSISPSIAVEEDDANTRIVAEENNVHLVWSDNSTGNYKICYKKHVFGGNEKIDWTQTIGLNYPTGGSSWPDIDTGPQNYVHVVWHDNSPGNNEIYYARSSNGGDSFSAPVRLTQNQGDSIGPAIAADHSNNVYVVWMDNSTGLLIGNQYNYEIYFVKSTDRGTTWSAQVMLTNKSDLPGITAFSGNPDIAVKPDLSLNVVWRANWHYPPGVPEIYYKRYSVEVGEWGADKRVTTSGGGGCFEPAIAVTDHDTAIHVIYTYEVPENLNGDIFYRKSIDKGASFSYESRLCMTDAYSKTPTIGQAYVYRDLLVYRNRYILHVFWEENVSGGEDLYYCSAKSWETAWSPIQRISNNGKDCYGVAVGVSDYNIHLAWSQKVGTESDHEVHYLRNRARVE
jgi:hypothetical protein